MRTPVPKCLFCEAELDSSTKPEHVLHNGLGGRKTTRRAICSMHNNEFGSSIDKALLNQVEVVRNLLQMSSGRGKSAPMLRRVKSGDDVINIFGDGRMELVTKPFTISPRGDGNYDVQITASTKEEIAKLIPNIAAALKMPEEQLREQLKGAIATSTERRPDAVHFSLSFGGPDAIRSAAKSCLVLWSTLVGNDEARGGPYDSARDFIVNGSDDFCRFRTHLDSRPLRCSNAVEEKYGPLFNSIYVESDASGRVIGHFTLYNLVGFQVILAESGAIPNQATALISNPLDPSEWIDHASDEFPVEFVWLDSPEYSLSLSRDRINTMMRTYVDIYRPKEVGRIVESVFAKHGFEEDDPVPQEDMKRIMGELTSRLAAHMLHLPHEERVPIETLLDYKE
jgi:HNH endonuclease